MQFRSLIPVVKLLLWSLLGFAVVFGVLEGLSRLKFLGIDTSYHGDTYAVFHMRRAMLEDWIEENHQNPDCFFIGSSMIHADISISVFEEAYKRTTDEDIKCFNFGVFILSPETGSLISEFLVKEYHPKLIIYGTVIQDYGVIDHTPRQVAVEREFRNDPWTHYRVGDFNWEGWIIDHSSAYRAFLGYRLRLEAWQNSVFGSKTPSEYPPLWNFSGREESNGHVPYIGYLEHSPAFESNAIPWIPYCERVFEPDVKGLERIADLNSETTKVLIIEMPQHWITRSAVCNGDAEEFDRRFNNLMTDTLADTNVPYWLTSNLPFWDDLDWSDHHLHKDGATKFSDWLGQEVGTAAQMGLFENKLTAEDLKNPPLEIMSISPPDYYATYGFSPENFEQLQAEKEQISPIPNDAVGILIDDMLISDKTRMITSVGTVVEETTGLFDDYPEVIQQQNDYRLAVDILDQTLVTEEMTPAQQNARTAWVSSGLSEILAEAGIDYVVISEFTLFRLEQAVINEVFYSGHYDLLWEWTHPFYFSSQQHYFLLKPIEGR